MKTTGNTILVTGGGSGIGLEIAKLFAKQENTVIITGRNEAKLEQAAKGIKNLHYIPCNITDPEEVLRLYVQIEKQFNGFNILVNNAGVANLYKGDDNLYGNAVMEINTNYLAIVNLVHQFLPLLKKQEEAAIINVSSVVSFSPSVSLPTYSASKAALHSYTQSLRQLLSSGTNIKVYEIMPPLVDTDMAKEIPSDSKLTPQEVALSVFEGLKKDTYEIHVGVAQQFFEAFFPNTDTAFKTMNRID